MLVMPSRAVKQAADFYSKWPQNLVAWAVFSSAGASVSYRNSRSVEILSQFCGCGIRNCLVNSLKWLKNVVSFKLLALVRASIFPWKISLCWTHFGSYINREVIWACKVKQNKQFNSQKCRENANLSKLLSILLSFYHCMLPPTTLPTAWESCCFTSKVYK